MNFFSKQLHAMKICLFFFFCVTECVIISSEPFSNNQYASWEIYYAYSSLHLIISKTINPSHKYIKHKIYSSFFPTTLVPNISLSITYLSVFATNIHVSCVCVCKVFVTFVSLEITFFSEYFTYKHPVLNFTHIPYRDSNLKQRPQKSERLIRNVNATEIALLHCNIP